jgi:hypothetical protein
MTPVELEKKKEKIEKIGDCTMRMACLIERHSPRRAGETLIAGHVPHQGVTDEDVPA